MSTVLIELDLVLMDLERTLIRRPAWWLSSKGIRLLKGSKPDRLWKAEIKGAQKQSFPFDWFRKIKHQKNKSDLWMCLASLSIPVSFCISWLLFWLSFVFIWFLCFIRMFYFSVLTHYCVAWRTSSEMTLRLCPRTELNYFL